MRSCSTYRTTVMPEVVRALVGDGVDVHKAVVTERTLEEVFFE